MRYCPHFALRMPLTVMNADPATTAARACSPSMSGTRGSGVCAWCAAEEVGASEEFRDELVDWLAGNIAFMGSFLDEEGA
jgi:hypothetical protein